MKIKVCGMREYANVQELAKLPIDIMGFIFYEKSPRFVQENFDVAIRNLLPSSIAAAGVFVNSPLDYVLLKQQQYNLQYIQLHGSEDVNYCKELKKSTTAFVIKSFLVDSTFNFKELTKFESVVDFFLFDTKTQSFGGSGQKFDWDLLQYYTSNKPFFISGGISIEDVQNLKNQIHSKVYCIDINSKFEVEPGLKDVKRIQEFVAKIK